MNPSPPPAPPLRLHVTEDWGIYVTEPGRGRWDVTQCTPGNALVEGFSSENALTISLMNCGSGVDIFVLHARVDDTHQFRQECINFEHGSEDYAADIDREETKWSRIVREAGVKAN